MLLSCVAHLRRLNKEWRTLKLFGQERNLMTSAIARMNMFLHGIEDFEVVRGDTLSDPKFVEGDRLRQFDIILAKLIRHLCAWQLLNSMQLSHLLGRRREPLVRDHLKPMIDVGQLAYTIPEIGMPAARILIIIAPPDAEIPTGRANVPFRHACVLAALRARCQAESSPRRPCPSSK